MRIFRSESWLRALSGLSTNFSAAWFALAFITPNLADLSRIETIIVLIRDVLFGIVFLVITVILEENLVHE